MEVPAQPHSPQHSRSKAMMLPGARQVLKMSTSKAQPSSLFPHFLTIIGEKYSISTNCVASHSCHLWPWCTPASQGEAEQPPGALPCWPQLLLTPWPCSPSQPGSQLRGQWLLGRSGSGLQVLPRNLFLAGLEAQGQGKCRGQRGQQGKWERAEAEKALEQP